MARQWGFQINSFARAHEKYCITRHRYYFVPKSDGTYALILDISALNRYRLLDVISPAARAKTQVKASTTTSILDDKIATSALRYASFFLHTLHYQDGQIQRLLYSDQRGRLNRLCISERNRQDRITHSRQVSLSHIMLVYCIRVTAKNVVCRQSSDVNFHRAFH